MNIWLKGDVPKGQGHGGVCDLIEHQLLGIAEGETFEEAVMNLSKQFMSKDKVNYFNGLTYWGYPLQPEEPC